MFSGTAVGNLGRDAETRQAGSSQVTSFSIATSKGWGDRKVTTWVEVSFWGTRGERMQSYLTKGTAVIVRGQVYQDEWMDRDGNKRYTLKMDADSVDFCPRGPDRQSSGGYQSNTPTQQDDDIPF